MRRLFFIAGFLLAATGLRAQEPAAPSAAPSAAPEYAGAHMAFEKTTHDFGSIARNLPKVECRFEFTNDGTQPLVITRTLTSCNCVKVSYDKKPVPPGGRGVIAVVYEVSKKEAGVFYKSIEIYSNSADKRNNLILKGNAVE